MARVAGTSRTDLPAGPMWILSATGIQEAIKAGKVLTQNGYEFDICYTSVLTRAIQTFNYAADELNSHYIKVIKKVGGSIKDIRGITRIK